MKFFTARFAILLTALLAAGIPGAAQELQQGPAPAPAPSAPLLSIDQLSGLLAPIALYPDPLLAQVLAASTYPLEIVEAQQWLLRSRNLEGDQLIQAARQQNWDASVQALVAFPDALALLSRDVRWTTDVGNAFLAQQQDVMNAIQNLRVRAQGNGQLVNGPQQVVNTEEQNGQSAIAIQPANPQVMYVPRYSPQAVWGPQFVSPYAYGEPAAYGAPEYQAGYGGGWDNGYGSGIAGSAIQFGSGVLLNALFNGVTHFTGWGWALNWLVKGLFMNPLFFHNNGFGGYGGYGGGYGGGYSAVAWVHNPVHRMGIAYPNPVLASRFGGSFRHEGYRGQPLRNAGYYREPQGYRGGSGYSPAASGYRGYASTAPRQFGQGFASSSGGGNRFGSYGSNGFSSSGAGNRFAPSAPGRYSAFSSGNWNNGARYNAPRSSVSMPGNSGRTEHYSAPHYSAPKAQHYSAPKAPHFSAPHFSGGHGGGGHGHSGGGGHSKSSRHH
ncbi:MAG TPA: DUF3300 domain-containing protein [Bryobacteraceae bacterium]